MNVMKFIGTLKKSVRSTMRYKGGTAYSIIRALFLYWDANKSGRISTNEMMLCMKSLGAKVSREDCAEIVRYYAGNDPTGEMDYRELLQDILSGEPSLIAFVTQQEDEEKDKHEIRFEEVADKFVTMPMIVRKFIEAVRNYVQDTMRKMGGTPHQHIRHLFQFYDYDYSNGLNPEELLTACRRKMNLSCTLEQAREIVDYYDRRNQGEIAPEKFIEDVCQDVKPILHFTELTPRSIASAHQSLAANPFIPKPFHAPPNKVLEKFKHDAKVALVNKVNKCGGSAASWIREAFVFWDPHYTRKISSYEHLQGAAARLGLRLSDEDARTLMKCYDRFNTGEMHYTYLADEVLKDDKHFLMDSKVVDPSFSATGRCPPQVEQLMGKLRAAANKFQQRSKGALLARDVLHGTFVRFDSSRSGRVSQHDVRSVVQEMKARAVTDSEILAAVKWFDSDGSSMLDYNSLMRQMYGEDVTTETLTLPRIGSRLTTTYAAAMSKSGSSSTIPTPAMTMMKSLSATSAGLGRGFPSTVANEFGVSGSTKEKNMDVVENPAVRRARVKHQRTKIISERVKVERRLASIEEQKQKIIEDYKVRRNK